MKKLIVHIGYPKTATTTLQHNLFKGLNKSGEIAWLHGNPHFNDNSKLIVRAEAHIAEITGDGRDNFTEEDLEKEKDGFKMINKEISVISDESLSFKFPDFSWVYSRDAIQNMEKIKTLFSPYFDSIEIIMTARNQQTIIPSFYVQCYKRLVSEDSRFTDMATWVNERFSMHAQDLIFDYAQMYGACASVFGKKKVHILIYEDLLHDKTSFYSALGRVLNVNSAEIERLIEINTQNTTKKSKEGYLGTKNSAFHKRIVSPVRKLIFKNSNSSFYKKCQELYLLIVPKSFRVAQTSIKKLSGKDLEFIHQRFLISNKELIENGDLDTEKMKRYKYI